MKKILLFLLTTISLNSFSQATLIKDINQGNSSSNPTLKTQYKSHIYFIADNGINGKELWRTDGTETGTVLFKEFIAGSESGIANVAPIVSNNLMFFFAADNDNYFLWKTDGTEVGTEKVKQFSSIQAFHETINNELIFTAENGLWKTNGTEAGTIKIANYTVFGNDRFVKNGNEIYFSAESSSSIGKELYKTNGTVNGTVLVKDIRPGSSDSFPNYFITINGITYFTANDGSKGVELWKTDGTSNGTQIVKDITTGSSGSSIRKIVAYNNKVYFVNGNSLWASDGTDNGTITVKDDLGIVKTIFTLNNQLLIIAYNSSTQKQVIWTSDGTTIGTTSFNPEYTEFSHNNQYTVVGDNLFFQGTKFPEGYELWKTDGTKEGTFLVKDIHPQADDNNLEGFIELNDKLIFTGNDGNWLGKELYISDGTKEGTGLLKDINTSGNRGSSPQNYFQFGDKILFSADNGEHGRELWIIENGIASMVKDINPGIYYSNPKYFTALNGDVYFIAETKDKGKELWKTDGTESGTILIKDINLNEKDGVNTSRIVTLNNTLYFFGDNGSTGLELWESDGTQAGTKIVKDINESEFSSVSNPEIVVMKNELFFPADNGTNGVELYKSDGTETGTVLVKEINSNGGANIRFLNVHPYIEKLYFSANDGSSTNLWESDGTSNTFKQQIKNPNNFTLSGTRDIGDRSNSNIIYNTELYFTGESTSNFNKKGIELWTVTYTSTIQQVFDINPGTSSSYPSYLTDVNGKLYFVANDGTHGNELWKANGVSGAELVKDIVSGSGSTRIRNIGSLKDKMFFNAPQDEINSPNYNYELWISDGTEVGTKLFQDINPSTDQFQGGSSPENFFTAGNTLYFSANNGTIGSELFQIQESALSTKKETISTLVKLSIYPNPTSDVLHFKVDNQQVESVKIYSLLGKEVMKKTIENNSIIISNLPKGIYLIQLKADKNTFTKKIIKN